MTDTITPEVDDETTRALAAVRARRTLTDAAGLIAYARAVAIPSLGTMSDGMPRAASKEAPLPFRADAIDDSLQIPRAVEAAASARDTTPTSGAARQEVNRAGCTSASRRSRRRGPVT